MFKHIVVASLAIAALAGAAEAQAGDTRAVTVSVAGIDTHSESGARIVLQRIKVAATSICGPEPSNLMDRHTRFEPCVQGVTGRTVTGLDNPLVTALLNKAPMERKLASVK